jgi:hypothetical protein
LIVLISAAKEACTRQNASRRAFAMAVCVGAVFCSSASAKDLDVLARLLIPAYIAQNFSALCASEDSLYLPELKGGAATVARYAEHVKKEITINMPEGEASRVRIVAANTALAAARKELRLIKDGNQDGTTSIKRWCERSAKPFILAVMNKHQERHQEFEGIVAKAKR